MAFRQLSTAPTEADFTPLAEHQEQTPTTFFGAKPVLHEHFSGLALALSPDKLQDDPAIAAFTSSVDEGDAFIKDVDVWVNSQDVTLFQNSPTPIGVSIPYPSIALHATMKWKSRVEALYMNLSLNDAESVNDEDDVQVLELTILPPKYESTPETECIGKIFAAMNKCADLHPDPNDSDAEDEEADLAAPGATGWITAENMDQFTDEDGSFRPAVGEVIIGEDLGPGAGTVRPREEEGEDQTNGVNGHDQETKWQRTD